MKKILVFLAVNCISFTMYGKKITVDYVIEEVHKKETEQVVQALTDISSNLMKLETMAWKEKLQKKDFTYPESVLSQSEVTSLVQAINDLESGAREKFRYRSPIRGNNKLEVLYSIIEDNAHQINEEMPFERGEVPWFKKRPQSLWKPIVQNFFKHTKALIKSFGPQTQKQAQNIIPSEGYSSHYFPKPKSGDSMRIF